LSFKTRFNENQTQKSNQTKLKTKEEGNRSRTIEKD
jgi:hypothetical protein